MENATPTPETMIRDQLAGRDGAAFWRSLDELADTADFRARVTERFPAFADVPEPDRRAVLKVMAASLALAGLSGCSAAADDDALPYVEQPEFTEPGQARWYASAVTFAGYAQPLLGKTFTGRPVKLEGNPDHPASRGRSDIFQQAALLGLYDPDRSQAPLRLARTASWEAFETRLFAARGTIDARSGEGFRLLTGATTSPTLQRQIAAMMKRWPKARWHVHEPMSAPERDAATTTIFGRPLDLHYALDKAQVVVSLDDDILGPGPHQTQHAALWAQRRHSYRSGAGDSRLFVAEPTMTLTGSAAAERLPAPPARIARLVRALATFLGVAADNLPGSFADPQRQGDLLEHEVGWVKRAARALAQYGGQGLVTVGPCQDPTSQALGLAINEHLGNFGQTLRVSDPIVARAPDGTASLDMLTRDMKAGKVTTLAILGTNPAYTAPADADFIAALEEVPLRIHAGTHADETAERCHWHLPVSHELESWSDARAVDGTPLVIQPLIRPFTNSRDIHAILDSLTGGSQSGRDHVMQTWRARWGGDFDERWQETLRRGLVAENDHPFIDAPISLQQLSASPQAQAPDDTDASLSVVLRPDPTLWDGRFADNAWLQETPKPHTKIVWGNVICLAPNDAREAGIANGDEVRLSVGERSLTGPAWILPGQAPRTLTLHYGHGRRRGVLASGVGFDAYALATMQNRWYLTGARLEKTGDTIAVASTQTHQKMDGHDFVRTVEEPGAQVAKRKREPQQSNFYPPAPDNDPSWGMSIDLDSCIGCNACVVACVAENNISMVGKDLVSQGREMHWLRVDHYHEGAPEDPKSYFQPVPCMHCENAPCEMGCPVNATVHSADGLNVQVYNRCIGTRTCSAYCPYKVRRFNWFDYTSDDPETMRAMRNPEVTVRSRGVMEKCTYCVQRISAARISAKKEGRSIADGEVVTACQQACPTQAISFGNISDPQSAVSTAKTSPRDYALLEETNTRPRTTYMARIDAVADAEEER